MTLPAISPKHARALAADGALLIDIRDAGEYAFEHIDGARNLPLPQLVAHAHSLHGRTVIFYCLSGMRTAHAAAELAACTQGCPRAYILEGGLNGWRACRLPVLRAAKAPLPLPRQVQITAGSMVLIGALLGAWLHPAFHTLSGFVGAGLLFAGLTGSCALGRFLSKMPWNRRPAPSAAPLDHAPTGV